MKLRYYLRGLAVGILVTTVILTIAHAGSKPLSDAQIREKALALGMVDGGSVKLSDLQEPESEKASGQESAKPQNTEPESSQPAESQTGDQTPEGTASESATSESAASESTTSESMAPEGTTSESTETASAQTPQGSSDQAGEPVTIQIRSGASSYTVSVDLAAAGLVEDAAAYDAYLCDKGYSRTIRTGTYRITPGTGWEEIAKMIAQ